MAARKAPRVVSVASAASAATACRKAKAKALPGWVTGQGRTAAGKTRAPWASRKRKRAAEAIDPILSPSAKGEQAPPGSPFFLAQRARLSQAASSAQREQAP